jgi:hypothetical protein
LDGFLETRDLIRVVLRMDKIHRRQESGEQQNSEFYLHGGLMFNGRLLNQPVYF